MLAVSGGRLILASTPWGKRGAFFKEWTAGGSGWKRFRVAAHDCPRITREFLEEEAKTLLPRWFRQEYECSFEETEDSVFDYATVESAITDEVAPLFGEPEAWPEAWRGVGGVVADELVTPLFGGAVVHG
jgi:hypothetical protein